MYFVRLEPKCWQLWACCCIASFLCSRQPEIVRRRQTICTQKTVAVMPFRVEFEMQFGRSLVNAESRGVYQGKFGGALS